MLHVAPFPDNTSTYRFLGFSDPCLPFIIHQQRQHVAGLLPLVLPVNSFAIKDVADVADFPDYTCHYVVSCALCVPSRPFSL
jgi:hypothetical protein